VAWEDSQKQFLSQNCFGGGRSSGSKIGRGPRIAARKSVSQSFRIVNRWSLAGDASGTVLRGGGRNDQRLLENAKCKVLDRRVPYRFAFFNTQFAITNAL
jgi:hypothetical protein